MSLSIEEALLATPEAPSPRRDKPSIPKLGEPGTYEWNGVEGTINTPPTEAIVTTYDEFLKDAFPGVDPAELEVIEPVQVRGWDTNMGEGNVVRMHYYRLNVRRRRNGPKIDDLLAVVNKRKSSKRVPPTGDSTFVVAIGDLQLGKIDGDGVEGTVDRALKGLEAAAARATELRKHISISTIHVGWMGDCIEGFVSQRGDNSWRTNLTLTEQIRLLRRIMLYSVELFSPLAERVVEVAVPGNHDQAVRFGGVGVTRYDDSFDTDALSAVQDAVSLSSYDNIEFFTPGRDELAVTLETSGTIIGHIHGHQTKNGKHFDWLAKQSLGDQPVGQSDILLAGHFHHFVLDTNGSRKFIQVPALEAESTWFRHSNGQTGDPGVLLFTTKDKKINNIDIV